MHIVSGRALATLVALTLAPLSGPVLAGVPASSSGPTGPTIAADSCSASDVQAALDAAPNGSTVTIPAGSCDWGSQQVARAAGVTLVGAGRGVTTIERTAPMTEDTNAMLTFDCSNGERVEVSGLTMIGNDDHQTEPERLADVDQGLVLINSCVDFEIHDVAANKFSHSGIAIWGISARGVIYLSEFHSNFKCQVPAKDCLGYAVMVIGDPMQPRPPLALGTQDAVFVEDSVFTDNRHAIASNHGSRYVFRSTR